MNDRTVQHSRATPSTATDPTDTAPALTWVRNDVSNVAPQGGYVAKQCPVRAQWDVLEPAAQVPVSGAARRRMDAGIAFEAEVFAQMAALHPDAVVMDRGGRDDRDDRERRTLDAMTAGARIILGGRLPTDGTTRRVGEPDVLVAAPGGGYHPVDVKHHPTLTSGWGLTPLVAELAAPSFLGARPPEGQFQQRRARQRKDDLYQLAHYRRMLQACGFAAPDDMAAVIGSERLVTWHDLGAPIWRTPSRSQGTKQRSTMEVYDFEFEFRLDVIAVAQRHAVDPSVHLLVVPVRTGECADCPWWGHCHQVLTDADDLSLLPFASWNTWATHRDRGVRTLADLAALDPTTDAYDGTKVRDLPTSIDMARARLADQPVFLARDVDRIEVPRGDLEIDLDLECDDDGGVYLWGTLVTDPRGTGLAPTGYRSFVTWEPDLARGEVDVFRQLCVWLSEVLRDADRAGRSVAFYCYNEKAEAGALRRLAALADAEESGTDNGHGQWAAFVEQLVTAPGWVDLLPVCRASLVTGHSMGLKYVAPLAGFRWEDAEASGEQSMNWYHDAVHHPDPGVRAADRARILTYNRNDVEATLALRDWLERSGPSLPRISDLDGHYRR